MTYRLVVESKFVNVHKGIQRKNQCNPNNGVKYVDIGGINLWTCKPGNYCSSPIIPHPFWYQMGCY